MGCKRGSPCNDVAESLFAAEKQLEGMKSRGSRRSRSTATSDDTVLAGILALTIGTLATAFGLAAHSYVNGGPVPAVGGQY